MPDFLSDLYTNLRAVVFATWPDCRPDGTKDEATSTTDKYGIWEVDHIDQMPWETLTPPYAIISLDSLEQTDWGGGNDAFLAIVDIYYVAEVAGPLSNIRAKLLGLKRAVSTADQTKIDVQRIVAMSWDRSLLPNATFAAKNIQHRAGRLQVEVLTGESADQT